MNSPESQDTGRAWRIATWIVRIIVALLFTAAGTAKLGGAERMVQVFAEVGVGQWFRYVTGTLEVAGAVLLLLPKTFVLGAGMLACVSVGAILTHLFLIGGSAIPALILLLLIGAAVWLHSRS